MKKKRYFIIIIQFLLLVLLSGCNGKKITTCKKCVFSYYTYHDVKDIGNVLENYTTLLY